MSVLHLGINCTSNFRVYEDTPIYVAEDVLFKIQGSLDVRSLLATVNGGLMMEARVFRGISNLEFLEKDNKKTVRSLI